MRLYLDSAEHNAAVTAFITKLGEYQSEDVVKACEQKYQELTKCPKCGREINWYMSVLPGSEQTGHIFREISCQCGCNSYKYTDEIKRDVDITYVLDNTLKILSKELKKINGEGLIFEGNVYK